MLNDGAIIGKVILSGIVVVAVMSCGCTKYIVSLPSSDAPPSAVVETFSSWYGELGTLERVIY